MILLIDLGNTRVKWAYAEPAEGLSSVSAQDASELESVLEIWRSGPPPSEIRIASVNAAAVCALIESRIEDFFKIRPRVLASARFSNGVTSGYAEPSSLGVDRWAAIIGAKLRSQGGFIVVDCGSAITVDAVDTQGMHRGGVIVPGLRLARSALSRGTARLPLVEQGDPKLFSTDTASAIASGSLFALSGGIDAIVHQMWEQLGDQTPLWLTGGDAAALLPHLRHDYQHVPELVLEGLLAAEAEWR